jgi:hypothetical protein
MYKIILSFLLLTLLGCSSLERDRTVLYEVDCKKGTTKIFIDTDHDEYRLEPGKSKISIDKIIKE